MGVREQVISHVRVRTYTLPPYMHSLQWDSIMADEKELILLIEDEPQMRRFLRITLQSHGYRLVEAATAQEGLMQATTRNPDVVLLDLGLPDLDGLEVTKKLR